MNILHFISSSGLFGAEGVLLSLARHSKEKGIFSLICCLTQEGIERVELAEVAKEIGFPVEVVSCRGRLDLQVISNLKAVLEKHHINLIHSHGYKSNFYALWVGRRLKIPVVATVHGWTGETMALKIYEAMDLVWLRFFTRIVAVSSIIKKRLLRSGIGSSRVQLITNGIDTDFFNPVGCNDWAGKRWDLKERVPVIGTAGRLNKEKGHIYLFQAAKSVCKNYPKAVFFIIGDGPLRDELNDYVEENGLTQNVIFAGIQRDLPSLYSLMDIYVSPSLTEGIPLVILEAMAMERPVVATSVGGVPQIIKDNKNGELIPAKDPAALAKAITDLWKDPKKRLRMARAARKWVEKNYSRETMGDRYLKLYHEILEK